jgi:hypothetical protein
MKINKKAEHTAEDAFLVYANYSIREDPKKFTELLSRKLILKDKREASEKIVDAIGCYIKEAIKRDYGCDDIGDDFCILEHDTHEVENIIGKEYFTGKNNLNCLDCNQMFFIKLLSNIAQGKEYSKIEGFNRIIDSTEDFAMRIKIVNASEKSVFKESLLFYPFWIFDPEHIDEEKDNINFYDISNDDVYFYIDNFFNFSLATFLLKDERNREKIKICNNCKKYFVKKRFREEQRFCSDFCRKSWYYHKPGVCEELNKRKRDKRKEGAKTSYY